jgi:hypothetical protein
VSGSDVMTSVTSPSICTRAKKKETVSPFEPECDRQKELIRRKRQNNEALWAEERAFLAALREKRENYCLLTAFSALTIQAAWRGHNMRKRWPEVRAGLESAILVRRQLRSVLEGQQYPWVLGRRSAALNKATKRAAAAVSIQSAWRGCLACQAMATKRAEYEGELPVKSGASVKIQSSWRGYVARLKFADVVLQRKQDCAALRLQCGWRQHQATTEVKVKRQEHSSALLIQSCARGKMARSKAQQIQSFRREELEAADRDAAAITLQCLFRCAAAKQQIQRLRALRQKAHMDGAATQVQRICRGFMGRREAAKHRQLPYSSAKVNERGEPDSVPASESVI